MSPYPERNARILELRDSGRSARDIAAELGCTRNAVIGVWHRASLTSGLQPVRKEPSVAPRRPVRGTGRRTRQLISAEARDKARGLYLEGLTYRQIEAATGIPQGNFAYLFRDLPRRRPVTWSVLPKPRAFRLEALALAEAGVPAAKVARELGFSQHNFPHWRRDVSLVEDAKAIAAKVKAEAAAKREERAAKKRAEHEARRARRDARNATALAAIEQRNPRHAEVVRYLLDDHTLAEAGEHFGFTRERARQIVAYAVAKYGLDTEGRFVGKPPKAMMTEGKREAKRRENFERLMKLAAEAGERIGRECMA